MNFEEYWNNYGELHASMCGGDIKQFAKEIWSSAQRGDRGEISDGYHTFNELYEHRHTLFLLCQKMLVSKSWKSKYHHDGTMFDGWFIVGIETPNGQVTYHLPIRLWDLCPANTINNAPEWDGHTSQDVLTRLQDMISASREALTLAAESARNKPTRVEVIDHRKDASDFGRIPSEQVELSWQDDDRTLKIFLKNGEYNVNIT